MCVSFFYQLFALTVINVWLRVSVQKRDAKKRKNNSRFVLVLLQQTTHREYHEKNCLHLGNFCCVSQNDSSSSVFLRVELWWRSWTDVGIKFLSNVFPFPGLPLILCFSTGKTLLFFCFLHNKHTSLSTRITPGSQSETKKKQKTYVSVEVTPMTQINTRTDPKSKEGDDLQQHISHSYFFFLFFI